MFHVTDERNLDSILEEGLRPQRDGGKTFFMDDPEAAEEYGEIMPTIEEPVVLEAEVMEHSLEPDDEEPGDFPAFQKRGGVEPYDVDVFKR
jgi:hypothetical protein